MTVKIVLPGVFYCLSETVIEPEKNNIFKNTMQLINFHALLINKSRTPTHSQKMFVHAFYLYFLLHAHAT